MPEIVVAERITKKDVMATLETLGRITAGKMILADELTETEVKELSGLFQPWRSGEAVVTGDLRTHGDDLYECIQGHTTQADWAPSSTPALWKIRSAPGVIPVWVQPTGAHDAYAVGARVQWPEGGQVWESTIEANTTEPGTLTEFGYWVAVE